MPDFKSWRGAPECIISFSLREDKLSFVGEAQVQPRIWINLWIEIQPVKKTLFGVVNERLLLLIRFWSRCSSLDSFIFYSHHPPCVAGAGDQHRGRWTMLSVSRHKYPPLFNTNWHSADCLRLLFPWCHLDCAYVNNIIYCVHICDCTYSKYLAVGARAE